MAYYSLENNNLVSTDAEFNDQGGSLGCEYVYITAEQAETDFPELLLGESFEPGDAVLDKEQSKIFFITEEDAE